MMDGLALKKAHLPVKGNLLTNRQSLLSFRNSGKRTIENVERKEKDGRAYGFGWGKKKTKKQKHLINIIQFSNFLFFWNVHTVTKIRNICGWGVKHFRQTNEECRDKIWNYNIFKLKKQEKWNPTLLKGICACLCLFVSMPKGRGKCII